MSPISPLASDTSTLLRVLLLLLTAAGRAFAYVQAYPGWDSLGYLFFFGDSYTTTGFNLTNGAALPTVEDPTGNPPWPGFTSSNGPNWAGYLTREFNESQVLTYNLAYGGATIDASLVKPYKPTVLSFRDQVSTLFLPYLASPYKPWTSDDSLFLVWLGINDIGNSFSLPGDPTALHEKLMDSYFTAIDDLYAAGARSFLFLNVPPIDRSPLTVGEGAEAVAREKAALDAFNTLLESRVNQFSDDKGDVFANLFDTTVVFNAVLDHPGEYGFKDAKGYCKRYASGTPQQDTFYEECGVRVDEYFWLNSLHPTWPMHRVLAEEVVKVL